MKRIVMLAVLALVLSVTFAAAQEVEIPVIFDRSWMDDDPPVADDVIKKADFNKSEIAISPDGQWLAFLSYHRYIWIVAANGGEPRMVYEIPEEQLHLVHLIDVEPPVEQYIGSISRICFSPDGNEITFFREYFDSEKGSIFFSTEQVYSLQNLIYTIESVNIDTGDVRTVIEEGKYPNWSADGRYLAYVHTDHMVYLDPEQSHFNGVPSIYDTQTGETRHLLDVNSTLTYVPRNEYSSKVLGTDYWNVVLTADNKEIICSKLEYGERSRDYNLIRISLETSAETIIPVDESSYWEAVSINRSPLGRYIVFSKFMARDEMNMLIDLETNETVRAFATATGRDRYGIFSSDGLSLIYLKPHTFEYTSPVTNITTLIDIALAIYSQPVNPPLLFSGAGPTAVEDAAPAPELVIGNYPNPFNPSTVIIFSLPADGLTHLDVYNLSGQKVRELAAGAMTKGVHVITWDGRTADGSQAASGIYIARISVGNHTANRRMTLMK